MQAPGHIFRRKTVDTARSRLLPFGHPPTSNERIQRGSQPTHPRLPIPSIRFPPHTYHLSSITEGARFGTHMPQSTVACTSSEPANYPPTQRGRGSVLSKRTVISSLDVLDPSSIWQCVSTVLIPSRPCPRSFEIPRPTSLRPQRPLRRHQLSCAQYQPNTSAQSTSALVRRLLAQLQTSPVITAGLIPPSVSCNSQPHHHPTKHVTQLPTPLPPALGVLYILS